jgi:hypothetical protein
MTAKTTQSASSHSQVDMLLWKQVQLTRLATTTTPVLLLLMFTLVKISSVFGLLAVCAQAHLLSKSEHSVHRHRQATGDQSEANSSLLLFAK